MLANKQLCAAACLMASVLSAASGAETLVDRDGDGLSDVWELAFDAQDLLPGEDADGDGSSNREECEHGTDPFDAASCFEPYRFEWDPEGVAFVFEGVEGQSYSVEVSGDLVNWEEGPDRLFSSGGPERLVSQADGQTLRFMRFRVGGDQDGDGLGDFEEKLLGTDPFATHSDPDFGAGDLAQLMDRFFSEGTFDVAGKQVAGALPSLEEASRFLAQASLSSRIQEIETVASLGFGAWIDGQFAEVPGYILPGTKWWRDNVENFFWVHRHYAWWDQVMNSSDLLRQRLAVALGEVYVLSDQALDGGAATFGMADFYDMLLDHSFGNWRDLLRDTSLHPAMGNYLSHLKNRKANPEENRYPDENYAREIMQLFSIGLFELNPDGSRKLDAEGNPIPTYDNEDITNFARVFTGFAFGGENNSPDIRWHFDFGQWVWDAPMKAWEHEHDQECKVLLNGTVLPAFSEDPGRVAMDDFEAAIDNLFHHPNVGPFISYRLIQRLVKSNPSPGYVQRVAQVFADNGKGVRGDMKSVVKAILLDAEARVPVSDDDLFAGRLREPYLRWVRIVTSLGAASVDGGKPLIPDWEHPSEMGQRVMSSNSVFNFFQPDYVPQGEMADAGLVGPEFQVLNSSTAMATQNIYGGAIMWGFAWQDDDGDGQYEPGMTFEFTDEIALLRSEGVGAVIDRLDLVLFHGTMTDATREIMLDAYEGRAGWFDDRLTVGMLVRIAMLSSEFAVTL
ncbi:DUF1800 family protein [Pelagicoccus sp. NFK12]|uniref:DUF1800 family protein n=1 Tax=Pelagicoccus enzymogenes TaxID=2773457 RepID=A0A927FCG4_9BACT|nr:DUF1800 family protein [Pelagicoccus enzymogenes]MBD5781236.1 DUF1800 family protein [Pelagicoccus enzymogenes]